MGAAADKGEGYGSSLNIRGKTTPVHGSEDAHV